MANENNFNENLNENNFIENYLSKQRKLSTHVQIVIRLRKNITRTLIRLPKRYRYIVVNKILELISDICMYCFQSESIQLSINMSLDDFKLRQRYLTEALSLSYSLEYELLFLYEFIHAGNNVFQNKAEYDNIFNKLLSLTAKLKTVLTNTIDNDKNRIKKMKGVI